MKKVYVIKNRYVDSVTLMGVAVELTELPGVTGAESGNRGQGHHHGAQSEHIK